MRFSQSALSTQRVFLYSQRTLRPLREIPKQVNYLFSVALK
jgi:hypothetical protein